MFPEQNHPAPNLPAGLIGADAESLPLPLKVLVVEDSPLDCQLVVEGLRNSGFAPEWQRVETEAGFLAGLQTGPDLVLSDFQMPRFNGLRALELLKERRPDIPFILVSGTIGEDTAVAAMQQGAADYLLKDRLARLGSAVAHALAAARLRRERQRLEQTQAENANLIRDVLNSLTTAVVVLDEFGTITATNERWRQVEREYGSGDSANLNYLTVCDNSVRRSGDPDAQAAADGIRRVLAGSVAEFTLEYPFHSPNERRWFLMRVSPLGGAKRGVVVAHENITAHKLAEEALRASKQRLRDLIDGLGVSMMVGLITPDGILVEANASALATMGLRPGDALGQPLVDLPWFRYSAEAQQQLREAITRGSRGEPSRYDMTIRGTCGQLIEVDFALNLVRDDSGKIVFLVPSGNVITERKQAESAMRESNEKFSQLADNLADAFWIRSPDMSEVQYISPAFEKIWGRTVASLQANPHEWSDFIFAEDRARVVAAFNGLSVVAPGLDLEYRIVRPSGEIRWVQVRGSQIRDSAKQLIRHIGVASDITARKQAETELRWKTAFLEAQVTSSIDGILLVDDQGHKVMQNQQVSDLFQIPPEIAQDKNHGAQIRWASNLTKDPSRFAERVAQLNSHRDEISRDEIELTIGRTLDRYSAPVVDKDGKYYGRVWTFRDVTERNRAAARLLESQQRLALATESAHLGIWDWDVAANKLVWDAQMCALYGIREQDFSGGYATWQKALHPEDRARCDAAFAAALAGPGGFHIEFRVVWPDGEVRDIEARAEVTRAAEGTPLHVIGINWDVTDRRRMETTLRQSEEKFRQLLEDSSDVIAVVNGAGVIHYQSPSTQRILGYQPEEVLGQVVTNFIHPEDRGKAAQGILRALSGELRSMPVEYRIRHREGTWRIFQSIGRMMGHSTGEQRVVVNSRDVTDLRKLELQFLRAQRLEAIGTLSSGIAHDLNNILAPIMMIVPMMRETFRSPQDTELLTMIEQGAMRGANIIKQLLTFSRGVEGERGPVQPRHLLKEMVTMMQETFPRDISIDQNLPNELWPISADATQIHQVLMNLCVNARDAMPGGGKIDLSAANVTLDEVEAALHGPAKAGPFVRLTITDTGEGISRSNLNRIFEPFFTTKEVGKGTGLGLSTVIGIVKSHGGFITVHSEPGLGTTFNVHLPAIAGGTALEAAVVARPHAGKRELILVVDDEAAIRRSVSLALERNNYRVVVAADGREAEILFHANRGHVRLLITDIMMPGLNGVALIQRLRAAEPHLPVIAASGLHDDKRLTELTALGVTSILAKPFCTEEVLTAVHRELAAGTEENQ